MSAPGVAGARAPLSALPLSPCHPSRARLEVFRQNLFADDRGDRSRTSSKTLHGRFIPKRSPFLPTSVARRAIERSDLPDHQRRLWVPVPLPPFPVPHAVMRAGLALRSGVLGLADRLLPAEAALWDFTAGMQRTKLAGVLVTSGIADALGDGEHDARELARELGLSEEVTLRVLGAAGASRLVHIDRRGRVRLARLGRPLCSDHPRSVASWVAYQAAPANADAHAQLEGQLREGAEPSGHRRAFGDSVWEYFAEHPKEGARFGAAMRELTAIDLGALARAGKIQSTRRCSDATTASLLMARSTTKSMRSSTRLRPTQRMS